MIEIIPTSLSQPEHCFSNSQVSSYNLMFLGIKIKLTCLQDPFCVNSCRLTKTCIDLWFEDNWTRVQYNCYFLPDVNKYTEEANDAPLSPNPTVVPRVNKVIHQEHMNKSIVVSLRWTQKANEVNEPKSDGLKPRSTELNPAPMRRTQSLHISFISNFKLCDFLICPFILNM